MKRSLWLIIATVICLNAVAIAQKPRTAMYRYQSNSDNQALAAGDNRKSFIGQANWSQVGLVGYVYREPAPGAVPLMEITKFIGGGNKFFYTTEMEEANELLLKDSGWKIGSFNKGYSCYVSPTKKPGTIPVYRYRQGTDKLNYLYIVGDKENTAFLKIASKAGMKFEKVAFYIWEKQADSSVDDSTANQNDSKSKEKIIIPGPIIQPPVIVSKLFPIVDFSMRNALYVQGTKTDKVDTRAKYVSMDDRISVKKSEAVQCSSDACTFNLGLIVFRNSGEGELSTEISVEAKNLSKTNVTVSFKPGEQSKGVVLPYNLKIGSNLVYVILDSQNKTAETDEKNNSLRVIIIVDP